MEKVLESILSQLDLITITGKDAERMAAVQHMVRDLLKLYKDAKAGKEEKAE